MSSLEYDPFADEPLPPQGEWRMPPYPHRKGQIEILQLLSPPPPSGPSDFSSGGQAHVFRVHIFGQGEYALKVFKFCTVEQLREIRHPSHNKDVKNDMMLFQSDPFFAECRAYARIRQVENELAKESKARKLAVPCLGFMALPALQFRRICRKKFKIKNWDCLGSRKLDRMRGDAPFRALVKELVVGKKPVFNPPGLLRDLKILRSAGVFPMDINARNYLDGLLVDFGLAWTYPHWVFDHIDSESIDSETYTEWCDFNRMIAAECPRAVTRAAPDENTLKKLRQRPPRRLQGASSSS